MGTGNFLLIAALGILTHLFWMGLFRQINKGRFNVIKNTTKSFKVISDFGSVNIDHELQKLTLGGKNRYLKIDLNQITGVRFTHDDEWARFAEWFFGVGLLDVFPAFRDRVHWYTIKLVLSDGKEVPIFVAGEYEPREFLMGWYLDLEVSILSWFGVLPDVGAYARETLDCVMSELNKGGKNVQLV
ncbi:MAG: hypothetical protein WA123_06785 [Methylotenera sp.]